jgi:putative transposase
VGRRTIFPIAADYQSFIETLGPDARTRRMRICGSCVMPNHWHMVFWPEQDGDLSAFMQNLTNLHVKPWKRANLVARAEQRPWSSLGQATPAEAIQRSTWPVPGPADRHRDLWIERVNRPQTGGELASVRLIGNRGTPSEDTAWVPRVAGSLHLGATLRSRSRPRDRG